MLLYSGDDIVIAKFYATANDIPPEFGVPILPTLLWTLEKTRSTFSGFPYLFWLPKDSKLKPVKYEGGRKVDDLLKYIAKHATNELKRYNRDGETDETD